MLGALVRLPRSAIPRDLGNVWRFEAKRAGAPVLAKAGRIVLQSSSIDSILSPALISCPMRNGVREQRLRQGLGQAELAALSGVTRQSIGAIEAGRHAPNVDAALRIAHVLGISVESLFTPQPNETYRSIGTPAPIGTPVVTAQVGTTPVYAPLRNLLSASESWALADGFVGDHGVEAFDGSGSIGRLGASQDSRLVVGGCDPLLGLAAAILDQRRGPTVIPVHLSTGAAVSALLSGVVHGVVVHGRKGTLPKPPVSVKRWRFASWQVGVASLSSRRELMSIEQMAERRVRTAQREDGAGTQRALQRALSVVGSPALPGPRVDGHIDAARHVVAGVPAGITMEAAARAFDLEFLPLETHHSELWIAHQHLDHQGAVALAALLCDSALVKRAQHIPGYQTSHMGTEVLAS
jgi:DNA-binding XRE family transcriptional regulator/molybdate-binding protein